MSELPGAVPRAVEVSHASIRPGIASRRTTHGIVIVTNWTHTSAAATMPAHREDDGAGGSPDLFGPPPAVSPGPRHGASSTRGAKRRRTAIACASCRYRKSRVSTVSGWHHTGARPYVRSPQSRLTRKLSSANHPAIWPPLKWSDFPLCSVTATGQIAAHARTMDMSVSIRRRGSAPRTRLHGQGMSLHRRAHARTL